MKKPVVMRLYPERDGGSLYVRVIVHPTMKAMRARVAELHKAGITHGSTRGAAGFSSPWNVLHITPERCRRDPCIAEVNLCKAYLGTEVVTHELYHATMEWGRRVRFPFSRLGDDDQVNQQEERIAYAHGRLCRQLVDRLYKAGLYPP